MDVLGHAASRDQASVPQLRQLLREGRLADSKRQLQFHDRSIPLKQQTYNRKAIGIRNRAQEIAGGSDVPANHRCFHALNSPVPNSIHNAQLPNVSILLDTLWRWYQSDYIKIYNESAGKRRP